MKKLLLFITSALLSVSAMATNVSGPMYASNLVDNDDIVLIGNTVLFMNSDLTLKSISGDYNLEIQGTNKLTVSNLNGNAISVASFSAISASLDITSSKNGLNVEQDITISGGNIVIHTGSDGVYSNTGNITMECTCDITSDGAHAIYAKQGDVSVTGNIKAVSYTTSTAVGAIQAGHSAYNDWTIGSITIAGGDVEITSNGDYAIFTYGGDINISGDVITAKAQNTAICAGAHDFTLMGGGCTAGDVTLNGKFDLQGDEDAIFTYQGDMSLISGSITAKGAIYTNTGGNITINGDVSVTSKSDREAIYTSEGNINITGNVVAKCSSRNKAAIQAGHAITNSWAEGGITIKGETINVTSEGAGVWAVGRDINLSGDVTINSRKDAICAAAIDMSLLGGGCTAGKVTLEGTFDIFSKTYSIFVYDGTLTLNSGSITSVGAIYAKRDITIIGDLNASYTGTNAPCIQAGSYDSYFYRVANVTIEGGKVSIDAITDAISAAGGNINLSGDVTIKSRSTAITAGVLDFTLLGGELYAGDVIFNKGDFYVSGREYAVWLHGNITMEPTYSIISPSNSEINKDLNDYGFTIVDANSQVAKSVHISAVSISGAVTLSTTPTPGNDVSFTVSGDLSSAEMENTWQISDDDVTWHDMVGATESTYTPKESDLGKYIRVKVTATNYSGYLYSPSRQITKKLCTDVPAEPILTNINDKVYLSNAKTTQEYLIFTYSKDVSALTENDWDNAVTPESETGFFELGGSTNTNNIVFTRIKETESTLASESVAEARLYIGTSVYLTDIELSISKPFSYLQKINGELNCKVGDVIRCDAEPVPSNATNWSGISGINWTVANRNTGSPYGTFYEDEDCTIPISSSTMYETVYLKTLTEVNYLEVRILFYNSAVGYLTRYKQFNVTKNGYFPSLDYINGCNQTIAAGEKITGLAVNRRPLSGSVYGLTTEVSGEGTAPDVRFSIYETMTIDATNATPGVYTYTPLQDGQPLNTNTTFTITVTDGKYAVDSVLLREKYITADPGESIELVAQLMPSNSESEIVWYSTDETNGPVVNGVVTIAPDAPIGQEIYITAMANGKYDNCKITVSGEEYGLYVASTQVTSRNRDDILGDGKFSYDGMRTLTINGDMTLNTPVRLVQNMGIDGLHIVVAKECTITQETGVNSVIFDLHKNTTISGEQMTVNGNSTAFNVTDNAILTLDNANLVVNAQFPFSGNIVGNESLNIIYSRVEAHAKGSAAVDDFNGGISLTDCIIQTPEGGEVVDATIEDGNGNQVHNLLIVPHKEKASPILEFYPTSVTVKKGEEWSQPTLWNPNGLTISYSSSNPTVATVDEHTGDVTLVATGTTTITAAFAGDNDYNETCASYILTVNGTTGIVDVMGNASTDNVQSRKVLIDGVLYILRDDKMYNAQGVQVK